MTKAINTSKGDSEILHRHDGAYDVAVRIVVATPGWGRRRCGVWSDDGRGRRGHSSAHPFFAIRRRIRNRRDRRCCRSKRSAPMNLYRRTSLEETGHTSRCQQGKDGRGPNSFLDQQHREPERPCGPRPRVDQRDGVSRIQSDTRDQGQETADFQLAVRTARRAGTCARRTRHRAANQSPDAEADRRDSAYSTSYALKPPRGDSLVLGSAL